MYPMFAKKQIADLNAFPVYWIEISAYFLKMRLNSHAACLFFRYGIATVQCFINKINFDLLVVLSDIFAWSCSYRFFILLHYSAFVTHLEHFQIKFWMQNYAENLLIQTVLRKLSVKNHFNDPAKAFLEAKL